MIIKNVSGVAGWYISGPLRRGSEHSPAQGSKSLRGGPILGRKLTKKRFFLLRRGQNSKNMDKIGKKLVKIVKKMIKKL